MYNAKGPTHEEKFAEWTKLIGQCIQSGKPIAQWCKENGICSERYHYWLKRVNCTIESLKDVSIAIETSDIMPVGDSAVAVSAATDAIPGLVQVNLRKPAAMSVLDDAEGIYTIAGSGSAPAMSIHIGAAYCNIYNGADNDTIECALRALTKTC